MGPAGGCYAPDPSVGTSVTRVINGYKVILSNYHAVKGGFSGLPYQELCAGDADGLWVDMTVYGRHPVLTPASVFARMKLLATDPAHWTTIPFG